MLPSGTLLLQLDIVPAQARQNLLRYAARAPWLSSLTVCLDPDGTLSILQGQGDKSAVLTVQTDLTSEASDTMVWFRWDRASGRSDLTVMNGTTLRLFHASGSVVLPLSDTDAARILGPSDLCAMSRGHVFVAISDRAEHAGPGLTLDPNGRVETPRGHVTLQSLRRGDLLVTGSGDLAQVRWSGLRTYPASGRFAPLQVRAPYHGARTDIIVAPDQQLCMSGAKVEYLFGEEAVRVSARHLSDGRAVLPAPLRGVVHYAQVLLDRPAMFRLSGVLVESMDATPFLDHPGMRRHSVLGALPDELLPRSRPPRLPALQGFEAMTLAH
jgi:hypothetical protein